jgi:hypothetical protein
MAPQQQVETIMLANNNSNDEHYVILPPCTTGDTAEPTHSILDDVHRVFSLIQDERILTAHSLYTTVQNRINDYKQTLQKEAEKTKTTTSPTKRLKQWMHSHRTKATTSTTTEEQHDTNTTEREEEEYRAAMDLVEAKREELNNMIVRCLLLVIFCSCHVYCLSHCIACRHLLFFPLYIIATCSSSGEGQGYIGT